MYKLNTGIGGQKIYTLLHGETIPVWIISHMSLSFFYRLLRNTVYPTAAALARNINEGMMSRILRAAPINMIVKGIATNGLLNTFSTPLTYLFSKKLKTFSTSGNSCLKRSISVGSFCPSFVPRGLFIGSLKGSTSSLVLKLFPPTRPRDIKSSESGYRPQDLAWAVDLTLDFFSFFFLSRWGWPRGISSSTTMNSFSTL
mmetsp:Transcript_14122/g.21448  ORF Transcript_14122/g.21448 Transcript_14122/m.21448 type:complete len:200 (+) Transcript_14122:71-670(+)